MAIDLEFLKKIPYFAGLSTAELDTIKKVVVEKMAARNDMLILEGDTANALYFVVFGVLKAFKTSADGKEQILNILRPGESFNDVSVFDNAPSPVTVQALGPASLYEITKTELEAIVRKYPQIARNVIMVLAGKVRHLISLVEDLSFRHVIGRVAKILLENATDGAGSSGGRLTQQDMAAMAGTAREVVGRSLKALEDEGLIRLDRNRIIIRDKDALKSRIGIPA
jgi:CRP-like cAMP-binding protein